MIIMLSAASFVSASSFVVHLNYQRKSQNGVDPCPAIASDVTSHTLT